MKNYFNWIIEFFIWVLLIIFFATLFCIAKSYNDLKLGHYYVFFDDVAGLNIGSAVNFMGKHVGYVCDLSIADDKVYVAFILKKNIKIPKNCFATIEFSGIAGAKSLELLTQNIICKSQRPICKIYPHIYSKFIPIKTYRIHDLYYNQKTMSANTLEIFTGLYRVFNEDNVKKYRQMVENTAFANDWLLKINNILSNRVNKEN